MEALFIILAILCIAGGIIFSILPPLPGPILTYAGMVCVHVGSDYTAFTGVSFLIWAIAGVIVIIADYALPIAATKKFGGTKAGVVGGMIGMIAGMFFPPFGIIIGPLLGAIIGDLYGGNRIRMAFKSGFGSFLGFIVATGLKLFYAVLLGGIVVWKVGGITLEAISQAF